MASGMGSPLEFMRRYWNPEAVLDALDIKAWPPSVDQEDETYYDQPVPEPTRRHEASLRYRTTDPDTAAHTAFTSRQQPPSPAALCPPDAALRIQSAYRGHRVRERVQRVSDLKAELEAVETRIMASLDQILGDHMERARVNEMIMDVLLRLDGVAGDDGVTEECRQYRKRVVKKAISLQEALDGLVGSSGEHRPDAAQPEELGREEQLHRGNNEDAEGESPDDDDGDDDRKQGNRSHDEEEKEEGEQQTRRKKGGCDGVMAALDRVMEENRRLRCLVRDLLDSNDQQSDVVLQLSERVEYLEKKLHRLGRKRRRSSHGAGAASSPSYSSSEGEDCSDREEGGRRPGDDQKITGNHDGGCEHQDDRRQR